MNKSFLGGNTQTHRPSIARIALWIFLAVLCMGALPAGWSLMVQPDGSGIGLPIVWLDKSPFTSFAIPGFILFALFGLGSLLTLYGLIFRPRWAWTETLTRPVHTHWSLVIAALIGLSQCIWIVVQLLMTQRYFFLQPVMFGVGLAIFILALLPAMRRDYAL